MRRRLSVPVGLVFVAVALFAPVTTSADVSASRPMWPSIAIDQNDHVHVAYDNADGAGIIYATNRSGSWVKRRITSGNDSLPRIAIDPAGKVRILFIRTFTDSPRRVYSVTNASGSWVTKQLPWTAPGSTIRIAAGPDGTFHVVYATDTATYYVSNATGSWVTTRLDNDFGTAPLVAVDGNNKVHLVFGQCWNNAEDDGYCDREGLYYRTNTSGRWVQTRLTEFQGDRATGLVADAEGHIHLVFERAFLMEGREELGVGMFHVTNASGSFTRTKVATDGRKGRVAVDPTGTVHIVYNRESETHLGISYATNETGSWVRSTAIPERAIYQELVADTKGVVRMVFMRMAIDPGVYYTNNRRGSWWRLELMD